MVCSGIHFSRQKTERANKAMNGAYTPDETHALMEFFEALRNEAGLSFEGAAKEGDYSKTLLCNLEGGTTNLSHKTLKKLMQQWRITPSSERRTRLLQHMASRGYLHVGANPYARSYDVPWFARADDVPKSAQLTVQLGFKTFRNQHVSYDIGAPCGVGLSARITVTNVGNAYAEVSRVYLGVSSAGFTFERFSAHIRRSTVAASDTDTDADDLLSAHASYINVGETLIDNGFELALGQFILEPSGEVGIEFDIKASRELGSPTKAVQLLASVPSAHGVTESNPITVVTCKKLDTNSVRHLAVRPVLHGPPSLIRLAENACVVADGTKVRLWLHVENLGSTALSKVKLKLQAPSEHLPGLELTGDFQFGDSLTVDNPNGPLCALELLRSAHEIHVLLPGPSHHVLLAVTIRCLDVTLLPAVLTLPIHAVGDFGSVEVAKAHLYKATKILALYQRVDDAPITETTKPISVRPGQILRWQVSVLNMTGLDCFQCNIEVSVPSKLLIVIPPNGGHQQAGELAVIESRKALIKLAPIPNEEIREGTITLMATVPGIPKSKSPGRVFKLVARMSGFIVNDQGELIQVQGSAEVPLRIGTSDDPPATHESSRHAG
jgi:hypothetical protein